MSANRMLLQCLRPWAAWLALCAALVGALVPAVSHAVAWGQGGAPGYGAICTTAAEPSGGQGGVASMAHCPFCLHSNDRVAPPPSALVCAFTGQDGPQAPTVFNTTFYSAPRAWAPPPRGPPLV